MRLRLEPLRRRDLRGLFVGAHPFPTQSDSWDTTLDDVRNESTLLTTTSLSPLLATGK